MVRKGGAEAGQAGEDVPWLQVSGASLVVQDLALAPRGVDGKSQPAVLQLAEVRVSDASLDLVARTVDVAAVSARGGRLAATRDASGVLDWQMLFGPAAPAAAPKSTAPKPAAPIAPRKIGVREIGLADWSAHFTDQGFARPLVVDVAGFGLSAALAGEVGATAALDVGPVNAALGPLQVRSGEATVAELQRAALVNAGLKLAAQQLVVEAVELGGAKTRVELDGNNRLNWADILQTAPGAAAPAEPATAESPQPSGAPFDVRLARLSLDGIEVGVVDQSTPRPVRLDIAEGFVTLRDLSLDLDRAVPLEAGFALRQGGRFNASGTVVPGRTSGALDLRLAGLSLKPFAPYVNQFARLNLHSGAASTRGKLAFEQAKPGMKLKFGGGFAVDDLAITEEETEEAFLGWKKLSSESLAVGLAPNRLHVNELVALNPFGKFIIFEDKSTNLQRILRKPASAEPAAQAAAPATPKPAAQAADAFPLASNACASSASTSSSPIFRSRRS